MAVMDEAMTITIKCADIKDAPELAGIHAGCFGSERWSEDQLRGSLSLSTTRGWVISADGKACGFILCQVLDGDAEILTFCVSPEFRRKGYGVSLIKHVLGEIASNIITLWLEVAEDNSPAIALYEGAGFVHGGLRPNYYKRGDRRINAIKYVYITKC